MPTSGIPLPMETWLDIASYLDRTELRSLVLVSRHFNNVFIGQLYSDLTITLPESLTFDPESALSEPSSRSRFASAGLPASLLFQRLDTHTTLRSSVRSIFLKNLKLQHLQTRMRWHPNEPVYFSFVGAIMVMLAMMPNVKRVHFHTSELQTEWIEYLSRHTKQDLDLCMTRVCLYGALDSGAISPLEFDKLRAPFSSTEKSTLVHISSLVLEQTRMCQSQIQGLSRLLESRVLTNLTLDSLTSDFLAGAFVGQGRPSFSRLQTLSVARIRDNQAALLGAFPNLRELTIEDAHHDFKLAPETIPSGKGSGGVLKRLERISAHSYLVPALTADRNVTSITTRDLLSSGANMDLLRVGPRFGSNVEVKVLTWRCCERVNALLDYLIANNPGIWHLTIDSIGGPASQGEYMPYVYKFAQLPELRSLKFATLAHAHTQTNHDWEREQCEYLTRAGNPFLRSVSLSVLITWTRHPGDETFHPSGPDLDTTDATPPVQEQIKVLEDSLLRQLKRSQRRGESSSHTKSFRNRWMPWL